mmetsp:Transcript_14899/g.27551  ORF Transcript_14899/g.27551 Transcript_14899/m.27551 type:complete len:347 (+) Transcript_14899:417-1457(+)
MTGLSDWVIGVALAISGAAVAALGDNLIKLSYRIKEANPQVETEQHESKVGMLWWALGNFCAIVLNTALTLASFAFVDASVSIPFGGLHILLNLPLSTLINAERHSRDKIAYNGIIAAGVLLTLIFGNRETTRFTVTEMAWHLLAPGFLACTGCILAIAYVLYLRLDAPNPNQRKIALVGIAGLVGACTQVFAKATSESLRSAAWTHPFTYIFVGLTIAHALGQVYLLNKCLGRYSASFVVPVINAILIVVGSLYAAVYFEELGRLGFTGRIAVPLGIGLSGLGIALLSSEPEELIGGDLSGTELSSSSMFLNPSEQPLYVRTECDDDGDHPAFFAEERGYSPALL